MDPRRLSRGEKVAGLGGLVLLVALFLPWYSFQGEHATAWQAMTVDDVILALAALVAIAAALATMWRPGTPVPIAFVALAVLPGAIAALIALWRLADPAPAADVGRSIGAWLGAAGGVAIVVGSWVGLDDEGPARRSSSASKAAADEARGRAELLSLPPEVGPRA